MRRRRERGATTVEWVVLAMIIGVQMIAVIAHFRSAYLKPAAEEIGDCVESAAGDGDLCRRFVSTGGGNGAARNLPAPELPGAIIPASWTGSGPLASPWAFGDPETALGAALGQVIADRQHTLDEIDAGRLHPDRSSRLGAYEATGGYPPGTVGHGVHGAIGAIYRALGETGEERIGDVFWSPAAQAELPHPINSPHSRAIATLEYNYWRQKWAEGWSLGGAMGSAFPPTSRDWIQWIFDGIAK